MTLPLMWFHIYTFYIKVVIVTKYLGIAYDIKDVISVYKLKWSDRFGFDNS